MRPFEVIFFDLDHTLIDTRGQYAAGLSITLKQLYGTEVPRDFQTNFMRFHNRLWKLYDAREIDMETLRRERFLQTWESFGVKKTEDDANQFQQVYDATFETTLHAYPGTREMLAALAQDHQLGIITNGSPDLQWRKTRITGLEEFFSEQDLIISANVGAAKPHPQVFETACRQFSVDTKNAVMIGDNFTGDVAGARSFGMAAVWYVPDDAILEEQSAAPGEPLISKPADVVAAIARMEDTRP